MELFTERGMRVLVLAQEEARTFKHECIGTEHLLLGMLQEDAGLEDLAAVALLSVGATLAAAREEVQRLVAPSEAATDAPTFTPRAQAVAVEGSRVEARRLGIEAIGPEEILLAILTEGHGVAVQVLSNIGVEPARLRDRMAELLASERTEAAAVDDDVEAAVRAELYGVDRGGLGRWVRRLSRRAR
jgi:ATP-dependent Clp protease ATP-binding subunit ClpC